MNVKKCINCGKYTQKTTKSGTIYFTKYCDSNCEKQYKIKTKKATRKEILHSSTTANRGAWAEFIVCAVLILRLRLLVGNIATKSFITHRTKNMNMSLPIWPLSLRGR